MRRNTKIGAACGREVLFALVSIHFLLPFTPVNTHPELRIKVASLILGVLFLLLGLASFSRPIASFAGGLVTLLLVYAISALGGASPIQEGLPIKIIFAAGLLYGALGTLRINENR